MTSNPYDPLVITLPVVVTASVVCTVIACLAPVKYLLHHRLKRSNRNMLGRTSLTSDSEAQLETTETEVMTDNQEPRNSGTKVSKVSREMFDRNGPQTDDEIEADLDPETPL